MAITMKYQQGQRIAEDVYMQDGRLVFPKGTLLTQTIYNQIRQWEKSGLLLSSETTDNYEQQYTSLRRPDYCETYIQSLLEGVDDLFEKIRKGDAIKENQLRDLAKDIYINVHADERLSMRVPRGWTPENYIVHHSVDVCLLSAVIALHLGLPEAETVELITGALLHDLGMYDMPQYLMKKKGKLSPPELASLHQHPTRGIEKIEKSGIKLTPNERACILSHHERTNGQGYPQGLPYALIPLGARIVAVADSFSAMTAQRAYRNRMDYYRAIYEISDGDGGHLDRHVVHVLSGQLRHLILNTRVRLSTGEIGYVVEFHENNPLQPSVLITEDAQGQPVVSRYLRNLQEKQTVFIQAVMDAHET